MPALLLDGPGGGAGCRGMVARPRRLALPHPERRPFAQGHAMSRAVWSLGGTVLAGGKSRRMGRDKAMLDRNGEPLWRRQSRVLRELGADPVTLVRRRGQPQLGGNVRLLYDTVDGVGPLAGLHVALWACRTH